MGLPGARLPVREHGAVVAVEGPEDDVEGSGLLEGERVKREIREKGLREGERR